MTLTREFLLMLSEAEDALSVEFAAFRFFHEATEASRRAEGFRLAAGKLAAPVDRNPEGEKPQALSAEHESAVAAGETPKPPQEQPS